MPSPNDVINSWINYGKSTDDPATKAKNIAGLYTTDAVLCTEEDPQVISFRDNIQSDFQTQFTPPDGKGGGGPGWILTDVPSQTVKQSTSWAWAYGTWKGTAYIDPNNSKTPVPLKGSWSVVLVQDSTGNWAIQQNSIVTSLQIPAS
jgi:hypothetical protein